jgi:protein TonB
VGHSECDAKPSSQEPNQWELPFEESGGRCGSCGGTAPTHLASPLLEDETAPPRDVVDAASAREQACEPPGLHAAEAEIGADETHASEEAQAALAVMSMAVTGNSIAPKPPRGIRAELVAVAVIAIVVVVGVPIGARWLRNQTPTQNVNASALTAPMTVVVKQAALARQAAKPTASARPEMTAVQPEPGPLPTAAAAARQPAVAAARPPRAANASKKAEPQTSPSQPGAPVLDFSPMTVAQLAVPATVPPPAPEAQVAPEAPAGRLFDTSEVDEAPRIATRIEPQLPASVAGRAVNDVVVVRILVSQTGHPFRVTVLRRSRLGPAVDETVVAAVKRWTFSPARKRGEVVSCWFNFGVALAN